MMKYKVLGKTEIKVSEVGLGCEHLVDAEFKEVNETINIAIDNGINFIDVFMAQAKVRSNIGKALGKKRKHVVIQGHLGAVIENNQPSVSRDITFVKEYFEDFLTRMKTDYVDIGYLHFVDSLEDFNHLINGEVAKYALHLKQIHTIRAIGLSTHNTKVAISAVNSGIIDCLMFPINPAFDLMPKSQSIFDIFNKKKHQANKWFTMQTERQELYDLCLSKGVGLVAMKPLGGGVLLNDRLSPFKTKLSVNQCINYCLSNKAISSVMVGCKNKSEVLQSLNYGIPQKSAVEVLSKTKFHHDKMGCMYCNHCLPCTQQIDIATVFKYYDIALSNNKENYIANHYNNLNRKASDCIACSKCMSRCPFSINIVENMKKVAEYFEA